MIYAKIYSYLNSAGFQVQTVAAKTTPDFDNGFLDFNVPSVNDLLIVDNAIATVDQAQAAITTLSQAQAAKSLQISTECQNAILAGFNSTALGTSYHYPAKYVDQQNLCSSILDSLLNANNPDWATPFWCMDENEVWSFRMHNQAQIQQVGRDAKMQVLQFMTKNQQLQDQVDSCTTIDQVNSISWN